MTDAPVNSTNAPNAAGAMPPGWPEGLPLNPETAGAHGYMPHTDPRCWYPHDWVEVWTFLCDCISGERRVSAADLLEIAERHGCFLETGSRPFDVTSSQLEWDTFCTVVHAWELFTQAEASGITVGPERWLPLQNTLTAYGWEYQDLPTELLELRKAPGGLRWR